jgi:hypothetical protein
MAVPKPGEHRGGQAQGSGAGVDQPGPERARSGGACLGWLHLRWGIHQVLSRVNVNFPSGVSARQTIIRRDMRR